jgi:glycosyltransferase involved in cell wall biosynthesis
MKILFVIRELQIGGAQRQLCLLANSLATRGHAPVIAVFYTGGKLESDLHEGVRVVRLGKSGRWNLLSFAARLRRVIIEEKPDIVHGYMSCGNLCALFSRVVYPKAKVIWGMRASVFNPESGDFWSRLVDRIEAWLSFIPHCIIVNSVAGMHYCRDMGFPAASLVHVPNAIDAERYDIDNAGRMRVRNDWKIKDGEIVVGLAGRLDAMKGHSVFLQAASILKDGQPELHFVCLGNGDRAYLQKMQQMAQQLHMNDRVHWFDARTDMRAVYNAFDVMCSASVYGEGFPNVVGEAMACARRVVVTDVGDSAFVVGETEEVVPINDPSALAQGILRQMALAGRPNLAARQRIRDRFSVARLTDTTESIFAELLRPPREKHSSSINSEPQAKDVRVTAKYRA